MKASNWLVYGLSILAAALLIAFWYLFGYYRIDSPLDVIIAVFLLIAVVVAIVFIVSVERKRKDRIRTLYVGEGFVYNSEEGVRDVSDSHTLLMNMRDMLENLNYSFEHIHLSNVNRDSIYLIIETTSYKKDTWAGKLVLIKAQEEYPFTDERELAELLSKNT